MTRDGSCNAPANLLEIECLIFTRELVKQFMQHVFDFSCLKSRGRDLHRDAAGPEWLGFKSVVMQFL